MSGKPAPTGGRGVYRVSWRVGVKRPARASSHARQWKYARTVVFVPCGRSRRAASTLSLMTLDTRMRSCDSSVLVNPCVALLLRIAVDPVSRC